MDRVFCDTRRCLGCRACELACAVEHSVPQGLFAAVRSERLAPPRLALQTIGAAAARPELYLALGGVAVSWNCRQCDSAPCIDACITAAMHREGDQVLCDVEKCVGCWMCIMACPFGSIQPKETALKCDLCPLRSGLSGRQRYACVAACPTEALYAGALEGFLREAGYEAVTGS